MSGPFVSDERFAIVVKYIEKKLPNGMDSVIIVDTKEMEERYQGTVKEVHTQWTQPNWIETNKLIRRATAFDPMAGRKEMDWTLYRQFLLEQYMRSWDITMPGKVSVSDGAVSEPVPVPCTPENINKLNPAIAAALVEEFVSKTSMPEDDLGN